MVAITQGHREDVIEVELKEGWHVFRLDAIAGGRAIRPEIGDLCVAIAAEDDDFHVLTPNAIEPWVPTESRWKEFLAEESRRMQSLNQRLRLEAGRNEQKYWAERHKLAKEMILNASASAANGRTIDQLCIESSGRDADAITDIDDYAFLRRITLDTIGAAKDVPSTYL